jgi:hypothetical protein
MTLTHEDIVINMHIDRFGQKWSKPTLAVEGQKPREGRADVD